jgi:hypothetical protein
MNLSDQHLYIGRKFFYINSFDKINTFTVSEIKEIRGYKGKILFCKENRWDVLHVVDDKIYYGRFDYGEDFIAARKEYLICDADCPAALTKVRQTLANKEIKKQKKLIDECWEKIKECWEVISKCNSVS